MSTNDSAALQTAATDDDSTDLSERDVRALTEYMTVLPEFGRAKGADGLYVVVGQNAGGEYLVDTHTGACECPDHEYRGVTCKHQHRVRFATGAREIPAWVDTDAVDPNLGEHVEGPRQAATDGGIVVADGDDGAEILDEDADDQDVVDLSEVTGDADVDDGCEECAALPGEYPCAGCYVGGAEWPDDDTDTEDDTDAGAGQ